MIDEEQMMIVWFEKNALSRVIGLSWTRSALMSAIDLINNGVPEHTAIYSAVDFYTSSYEAQEDIVAAYICGHVINLVAFIENNHDLIDEISSMRPVKSISLLMMVCAIRSLLEGKPHGQDTLRGSGRNI